MLRFTFAFLVLTTYASAQSATFSGLVMDGSEGVPLEGATVTLRDSGLVATTDAEGRYSFEVKSADAVTFSKDGYGSISRNVKSTAGAENVVLTVEGKVTYVCTTADAKGRWQIARTVFDPQTKTSKITYLTDTTQWNFKPNFSPDGSKLTFFRRYAADGPCCGTLLSSVCVMNADDSYVLRNEAIQIRHMLRWFPKFLIPDQN